MWQKVTQRLVLLHMLLGSALCLSCPNGWSQANVNLRCIKVTTSQTSFDGAAAFCKLFGGTLVGISNAFDNSEIYSFTRIGSASMPFWIGLSNENYSNYYWQNGQPVSYTNWAIGYPQRACSCAVMDFKTGKWNDNVDCDDEQTAGYICEWGGVNEWTTSATTKRSTTAPLPTAQPFFPCAGQYLFVVDGTDKVVQNESRQGQLDAISHIVQSFGMGNGSIAAGITEYGYDPSFIFWNGFEQDLSHFEPDIDTIRGELDNNNTVTLSDLVDFVSDTICDAIPDPSMVTSVILFSGTSDTADIGLAESKLPGGWSSCSFTKLVIIVVAVESGDELNLKGLASPKNASMVLTPLNSATYDHLGQMIEQYTCH